MESQTQISEDNRQKHDKKAALRFMDNLYQEILLAKELQDIQDPLILKKFAEYILVLKKENTQK